MSEIPGIETPEMSIPELQVPDRCDDCPLLCELQKAVEEAAEHAQSMTVFATTLEVPAEVKADICNLIGLSEELVNAGLDNSITTLRQQTAEELEIVDAFTENMQSQADFLTSNCPGQFRMRARNKAGSVITATLCESPGLPSNAHHQPVHIKRS